MKLEQALHVLPEVSELLPLREALLGGSHADREKAWAGSEEYATIDTRVADLDALEAQIPALVERLRERIERMYGHTLRSMRALERGDAVEAARELVRAGEVAERERRLEEAERYYARAAELGRKPRNRQVEGLARRRLGRVARAMGQWARAQEEYARGHEIAEAMRDREGVVVACQGMGNVLVDQGRWSEARDWYLRGVAALEDRSSSDYVHLCNSLSVVERRLGRLEESEEWLARGEAAAAEVNDEAALGYLEHGRARLLMARQAWAEAERVLARALGRGLDAEARVSTLLNLAEPVQEQGRLGEAERLVREAEEVAIRQRVGRYLPYVYRALGELARRRRDADGFLFFEQALSAIREQGLPVAEEAAALLHYARFERALGERESARARLQLARGLFRSIGAELEAGEVESEIDLLEGSGGSGSTVTAPPNS